MLIPFYLFRLTEAVPLWLQLFRPQEFPASLPEQYERSCCSRRIRAGFLRSCHKPVVGFCAAGQPNSHYRTELLLSGVVLLIFFVVLVKRAGRQFHNLAVVLVGLSFLLARLFILRLV